MKNIPFNVADFTNKEIYQIKLLKKKNFLLQNYFSNKCNKWLKDKINCKESLLVNSCTSALEMCALLLNIKSKDEIIMPSYTFVSTANAFVLRGGKPVFVDIKHETLNIDPVEIEKEITKKTKAIVVVHYAGVSCDMEKIKKISKKYNLYLIEDAAHAILSKYKNKYLGSFGDLATFSFHETKNLHCGSGGALIINNKKFIERAKILHNKGTNRDKFNRSLVKKYTWVDKGSAYAMNQVNAAVLYSQFKKSKELYDKRIKLWKKYFLFFNNYKNPNIIKIPRVIKGIKHNAHIFYIIVKNNRDKIIKELNKNKINTVFHYIPLHSSPGGKKFGKTFGNLKNTNFLSKRIIRLPLYSSLKLSEQKIIFEKIKKVFK